MSARALSRWIRCAALISCAAGCQVVFGDFTFDRTETPVALADACRPNAYHCNGATLELCADDRSGYLKLAECASADECDPTAGACRPCESGELACNENVLLSCSGARTWEVSDTCVTAELCQLGSDRRSGSCDPGALGCEPGAVRCEGERFERCVASGERWDLVELCGGSDQCVAAEGEVTGCLPAACEGEDCPPPECQNGDLRCDPSSGLTLQRCNAAGRYVTLEACVARVFCRADLGRCLPPACERNEKRCLGQKFQTCRSDRAWFQTTKECAPDQACDPIEGCVSGCVNDAKRCNGPAFERCVDGAWLPQQICATQKLCNVAQNGCDEPTCGGTLPSFDCGGDDDKVIFQCAPGRDAWEEIGTCDAGDTCVPERPFCVPE